jgi:hypothetical protein
MTVLSGLMFGFTGSYIFSQTIFTYRTGVHSRWIGILIMIVFLAIVASTVNFLQVAPLFFLGSTLIFIGYDLLYEWVRCRHSFYLFIVYINSELLLLSVLDSHNQLFVIFIHPDGRNQTQGKAVPIFLFRNSCNPLHSWF